MLQDVLRSALVKSFCIKLTVVYLIHFRRNAGYTKCFENPQVVLVFRGCPEKLLTDFMLCTDGLIPNNTIIRLRVYLMTNLKGPFCPLSFISSM